MRARTILTIALVLFLLTSGCTPLKNMGQGIRQVLGFEPKDEKPPETRIVLLQKIWWLPVLFLTGIVGSVFLLVQGQPKYAIPGAAACGVGLVLSITMIEHFRLLAWIGAVLVAAIIGFALWQTWKAHKESEKRKKAVTDLVVTGEAAKENMTDEAKVKVFGTGDGHGLAGGIQSPETEELVAVERAKIKPQGSKAK